MRDLYLYQQQHHPTTVTPYLDPRILTLVENILDLTLAEKHYKIVVGIALESMRIDIL